MKWITRERARVDRIACPWLIARFIDPKPEFLFVPAPEVLAVAQREDAIPYDVPNVELLARSIFSRYLLAFEATSVLLVIAVVGAVVLARRPPSIASPPEEEPVREVHQ